MTDLFSELRRDHERIGELLAALRGDPATEGPSPHQRKALAEQLIILESKHEAVEKTLLWPAVRALIGTDQMVSTGLDQESGGKKPLNELDKTRPGNEDFATLVVQVESNLRRHVMYEESQV